MNKDSFIMNADKLLIKEDQGSSWQSRFFTVLLRLLPIKRQTASAAAVQKRVRKLALRPASYEPKKLGSGVTVTRKTFAGWPVYYTAPTDNAAVHHYVVFLHGGGYINEIVPAHWRIIGEMTRKAGVHCVVPIYPLAPGATAKDIVPVVGALLRDLMMDAGVAKVTLMGNSAGAGMSLAAAQWLRDNGCMQPEQLVLISPGLDAGINRAEQVALAKSDPIQDIPGMKEGARMYAGEQDIRHPYVSPLNGDCHDLAPMIIFSGTLDLLYPDSVDLAAKASAAGVPVRLYLKQGQVHNYVAMPTPEGREAMGVIMQAISKNARL
ncbi:alpha/beta hydrolase [Chitinophaga sp. Hz27]|uniref:alpha/beta hydrolase n=1 Tax=Chitinophaga sp. Hz27 TaxID=3347169 RepID=UPI0035DB17CC